MYIIDQKKPVLSTLIVPQSFSEGERQLKVKWKITNNSYSLPYRLPPSTQERNTLFNQ